MQPHDGHCAFDEASKTLILDERTLSDMALPQSISWEGFFDRNVAYKYRFTYFISRSDSYQNNISDYLEDVMDWNGDDCEAVRHGINQSILRLKCKNDKSNITIKPAKASQRSKLPNTLSLELEYIPRYLRD